VLLKTGFGGKAFGSRRREFPSALCELRIIANFVGLARGSRSRQQFSFQTHAMRLLA
jgi:hypothetical protein